MTGGAIYAVLTVVLGLILDLVPGVKEKWEAMPIEGKRWAWLLGSVGVPVIVYGGKCVLGVDPFGVAWECGPEGLIAAGGLGVAAYYLSQGAHGLAKASGRAL